MSGEDDWDFYPCRVDDAPASIFLNLRWERTQAAGLDTHYWLTIAMHDKGEHGMGTAAEAEVLYLIEDDFIKRAEEIGFVYVGTAAECRMLAAELLRRVGSPREVLGNRDRGTERRDGI